MKKYLGTDQIYKNACPGIAILKAVLSKQRAVKYSVKKSVTLKVQLSSLPPGFFFSFRYAITDDAAQNMKSTRSVSQAETSKNYADVDMHIRQSGAHYMMFWRN